MFNDTLIDNTIWTLRKAFKNNKAQIWKALEKEFSKSRSNRRRVNIQKLNKVTNNGDIVIVPGKILGNGTLGHKLTVYAYSFSETALNKLNSSGNEVISLQSLISKYPDGKGVKILEVENDGAAAKAGLKKDDVITHVDDNEVNSTDEVKRATNKSSQYNYNFKVLRNGKAQTVEVKLQRPLKKADL